MKLYLLNTLNHSYLLFPITHVPLPISYLSLYNTDPSLSTLPKEKKKKKKKIDLSPFIILLSTKLRNCLKYDIKPMK